MGIPRSCAAAQKGSYSGRSYDLSSGGYTVIMAPANPIPAHRSSSFTPFLYVVQVDHRYAFDTPGESTAELGEPVIIGPESRV